MDDAYRRLILVIATTRQNFPWLRDFDRQAKKLILISRMELKQLVECQLRLIEPIMPTSQNSQTVQLLKCVF